MLRTFTVGAVMLLTLASPGFAQEAVTLGGAVTTPLTLDEATLTGLPATTLDITFETSSGPESGTYTGVLLWDLLTEAGLGEGRNASITKAVVARASDDYAALVAAAEADPRFGNKPILIAYDGTDEEVDFDHLRLFVPSDVHGGRAVRDLVSLEVR